MDLSKKRPCSTDPALKNTQAVMLSRKVTRTAKMWRTRDPCGREKGDQGIGLLPCHIEITLHCQIADIAIKKKIGNEGSAGLFQRIGRTGDESVDRIADPAFDRSAFLCASLLQKFCLFSSRKFFPDDVIAEFFRFGKRVLHHHAFHFRNIVVFRECGKGAVIRFLAVEIPQGSQNENSQCEKCSFQNDPKNAHSHRLSVI